MIYLLLIFVFAVLYWTIPYGFTHSNLDGIHERRIAAEKLATSLQDSLTTQPGEFELANEQGWQLRFSRPEVAITSLEASETGINFWVGVHFSHGNYNELIKNDARVITSLQLKCFIDGRQFTSTVQDHIHANVTRAHLQVIAEGSEGVFELDGKCQRLIDAIFPKGRPHITVFVAALDNVDGLTINLESQDDFLEIMELVRSMAQGRPSGKFRHSFTRMLYLSAVTITTLGFGDIVPATDFCRLLIAVECVSGIVLIGLFLNSSYAGRQKEESRDDATLGCKDAID